MPHPKGEIQVDFTRANPHLLAGYVTRPPGVTGVLEWAGVSQPLSEGKNHFQLEGR
jgi:hypothetical protein